MRLNKGAGVCMILFDNPVDKNSVADVSMARATQVCRGQVQSALLILRTVISTLTELSLDARPAYFSFLDRR